MKEPAAPSDTLAGLLADARGGDPAALDRLFGHCRNYLGVLARARVEGRLRAKADASDVVQQTMLEAYRGFGRFEGESPGEWLAWLRRILDHNAADFARRYGAAAKRTADREVPLQDGSRPGAQPADPGESPSARMVREETELRLADALAALPEDYREVVSLRNLQRLPFDEVARRMGRSPAAAQMLWTRAVRKLREAME